MSQTVSPREASATVPLTDKVIRAGAIYSMAEDRKVYRSIALRNDWIVAVSEDPHGLDGLITPDTFVVDEPELTILPAFDDTHNHFILGARHQEASSNTFPTALSLGNCWKLLPGVSSSTSSLHSPSSC
jgi:predicted amidohydrolase YtcJ